MRNQKRKFYHGELFEIDINKIPKKDKRTFVGVKKIEINFGDFTKPCKIEGLKVGYGVRLYFGVFIATVESVSCIRPLNRPQ